MPLPEDFKKQVVDELAKRGVKPQCEICGHNDWVVVDQAVSLHITDLSGSYKIPPPQIPSAGLICKRCGNIRIFALGALDLLPDTKGEKK